MATGGGHGGSTGGDGPGREDPSRAAVRRASSENCFSYAHSRTHRTKPPPRATGPAGLVAARLRRASSSSQGWRHSESRLQSFFESAESPASHASPGRESASIFLGFFAVQTGKG